MLGLAVIDPREISSEFYGPSTARAVLKYKGRPRNIINTHYQLAPDNIVGKMTIAHLDKEMEDFEKVPISKYVSITKQGAPHDHSKCNPEIQVQVHQLTPINPSRFGMMINIYGTFETDYLGFQDYSCNPLYTARGLGKPRPLSFPSPLGPGLASGCASDICMRSSPVYTRQDTIQPDKMNEYDEIARIAMPGCRITFAGEESFARKLFPLGPVIEKVTVKTFKNDADPSLGEDESYAWVIVHLA